MGTFFMNYGIGTPPSVVVGCGLSMRWPAASLPEQATQQAAEMRVEASAAETRNEALEQIYRATSELIYKFIYFKVGNREDAEDLTAQVYIKAAVSLDLSQDARARAAWLYQVARTTISDHWRYYYKHAADLKHLEDADLLEIPGEPICLGNPYEDEWTHNREMLRNILCRLPDKYRRVLQLRFLRGFSAKEIAAAMDLTEGGVRVIQHRALHKALEIGAQLNMAAV